MYEKVKVMYQPPSLPKSQLVLTVNGIGTESFVAGVLDTGGDVRRAVGNEAAGAERYSARVKCPSGGMKDSDLSRVHRWSLEGTLASRELLIVCIEDTPYASMKRTVRQGLRIRKRQKTIGSPYELETTQYEEVELYYESQWPDNLQLASIFPHTVLDSATPFLL